MRKGPLLIFSPLNKPVFNARFSCSIDTNTTFLGCFVQSLKSDIASLLEYQTCLKFRYIVQTILGQFDNFKHSTKIWSYNKIQILGKNYFFKFFWRQWLNKIFKKLRKFIEIAFIEFHLTLIKKTLAALENTFLIFKLSDFSYGNPVTIIPPIT